MRRSACQGILVLFMSCLLVTTSTAEPSATRSPDLGDSFQRDYLTTAARPLFPQLWDDLSYIVNEPDFYYIIGGVALGPTLADEGFDHEEPRFTNLWGRSRFADNLFELGEKIGDGAFPVAVAASSYGVGRLAGSSRMTEFGSDLFRVQAVNGLLTAVLKGTINRTRPDGTAYSYPSGHTSSSFATAGVIYSHFGKTWGYLAFGLAGYVGLSRLQEGKHYVSDVIAGAVLGTYVSSKLSRRPDRTGRLSVSPMATGDGMGISLRYSF